MANGNDGSPRIGSLFSGYAGLDLGVMAAIGGQVVWHCEARWTWCPGPCPDGTSHEGPAVREVFTHVIH